MTDGSRRRRVAVVACALLAGCASRGTVVLLPEKDGRGTAVVVRQGDKDVVLDRPYAGATMTTAGPRAYQSNAQEVEARFGQALAAQPTRPQTFTLYFIEGKDEFTDESKEVVDRILSEIATRPVPDVLVVGHTDALGSDSYNDELGQKRADAVRAALIRLGIPSADVHAISRGRRAPAVPTAQGVAEPRNRRVEIIVR
jgi:outer membrane protein OmpA-like peptidoglycan-associated protein